MRLIDSGLYEAALKASLQRIAPTVGSMLITNCRVFYRSQEADES